MKKLFDRIYFFFLQRFNRSTIIPMGEVTNSCKGDAYGVKMLSSIHNKENLPTSSGFIKNNEFYQLPFTKDEEYFVYHKSSIDENQVKRLHYFKRRNLSYKELLIIELCSKHAILVTEKDFLPN
ncbi:MAG: hypothetical protein QM564_13290 [Bergeyella sp.]